MINDFRLWLCNFIVTYIPFHLIRILLYKKMMGFKIGNGSSIHLGCKFNSARNFSIGRNSTINQNCWIDNRGGVTIGDNVSISPHVKIVTADHDLRSKFNVGRSRRLIIKDFVFIGSDSMVLGGIIMERGSILGAKSLLTKSTVPFGIYFGIPAKLTSMRQTDIDYIVCYKRWFH